MNIVGVVMFDRIAIVLFSLLVTACSQLSVTSLDIPPLQFEQQLVTPQQAKLLTPSDDPLALNDEMRRFIDKYIVPIKDKSARIAALNSSLFNTSVIGMEYDRTATFSAIEAYQAGRANCVGFANLFVAMGRYANINTRFQQVRVKPTWERREGLLYVPLHMNVVSKANASRSFVADIDKQSYVRANNKFLISDENAIAQYYNNLAMDELELNNCSIAYSYLARGIEADANVDFLWSNLGYLFRRNGQFKEAELSYQQALRLDKFSRNAMKNLAVLYEQQGRLDDAQPLFEKLKRLDKGNPYRYANIAFEHAVKGEWDEAIISLDTALELKPEEIEFHLAKMKYLFESGEIKQALVAHNAAKTAASDYRQTQRVKSIFNEYSNLLTGDLLPANVPINN